MDTTKSPILHIIMSLIAIVEFSKDLLIYFAKNETISHYIVICELPKNLSFVLQAFPATDVTTM